MTGNTSMKEERHCSTSGATFEQTTKYSQADEGISVADPHIFFPPFIIILGLTGNILSAVVMRRPSFRPLSTSVYLMTLGGGDIVYLCSCRFTVEWIRVVAHVDLMLISDWSCKLIAYIFSTSSEISAWLVVAVTAERLLVVCVPLKVKRLCTKVIAAYVSLAVVLSVMVLNVHILFLYVIEDVNHKPMCYIQAEAALVVSLLDSLFYSFVPTAVIFSCNVIIIYKLRTYERDRVAKLHNDRNHIDTRRLSVMLIVISVTFSLFTLPLCIYWTIMTTLVYRGGVEVFQDSIFRLVARILASINHAINFLLYCFSGPAFRKELRAVCSCSRRKQTYLTHEELRNQASPNGISAGYI